MRSGRKLIIAALVATAALFAPGCRTAPVQPPRLPEPRQQAALHLSERARKLLHLQRYDEAIRVLEKAITLEPRSGDHYFLLAEAWLGKGVPGQARHYHVLATRYLGAQPDWQSALAAQAARISNAGQ